MLTENDQSHDAVCAFFTRTEPSSIYADKKFTIKYQTGNINQENGVTILYGVESAFQKKPSTHINLTRKEFAHLAKMMGRTVSNFSDCDRLKTRKEYETLMIWCHYPVDEVSTPFQINIGQYLNFQKVMEHVLSDVKLMKPYIEAHESDDSLIVQDKEVYRRLMIAHVREIYERLMFTNAGNGDAIGKCVEQALDMVNTESLTKFLKCSNLEADENMNFEETRKLINSMNDVARDDIYPTRGWFTHNSQCKLFELYMMRREKKGWKPCPRLLNWFSVITDHPGCQLWVDVTFKDGHTRPHLKLIHDRGTIMLPKTTQPTSYERSCCRTELDMTLIEAKQLIRYEQIFTHDGVFGTLRSSPSNSTIHVKYMNENYEEETFYLDNYEEYRLWEADKKISEDLNLMLPCLRKKEESDIKIVTDKKILARLLNAYARFLYEKLDTGINQRERAFIAMSGITLSGFREFLQHSGIDCGKDYHVEDQPMAIADIIRCYFPSQALFIHNANCRQCSRMSC